MNSIVSIFKPSEVYKWAVLALLILWASTTFSIALMEISTVVALVFWAAYRVGLRRRLSVDGGGSFCPKVLWFPLALFFGFVLLSFCFSEYPKQSFRGVFKIAKPLLVFFATSDLFRSCAARKRFGAAFLITFLLVVADSSVQYAFGKSVLRGFPAQDSNAGLRIVGPFGDFGKMSAYLILVIPVFLLRFWAEFSATHSRKRSFYALALTLAGFTLLYLTRCRAPVVALILALGCLLIYRRCFKAIGIGIIFLLIFAAITPRSMIIHLDGQEKEQSIAERFHLWRRAFDVIYAKPIFGTGINTYDKAHARYDTIRQKNLILVKSDVRQNPDGSVSFISDGHAVTTDQEQKTLLVNGKMLEVSRESDGRYYVSSGLVAENYYAHNGYLQLASEIGIPGILFFAWVLVVFFFLGLRATTRLARGSPEELEQLGMLTGLLAFLLYAAADTGLQSPQSLMSFWFMAGVLVARQNHSQIDAVA